MSSLDDSFAHFLSHSIAAAKQHNNSMNIFGDKFISLSYEKINFIYYFFCLSFCYTSPPLSAVFCGAQVSGNDDDDILFEATWSSRFPVSVTLMLSQTGFWCGLTKRIQSLIDFWLMPPYLMIAFFAYFSSSIDVFAFLRRLLANNE